MYQSTNCIHFDYGEKSECHLRIKCRQSFFLIFWRHTQIYTLSIHILNHIYMQSA